MNQADRIRRIREQLNRAKAERAVQDRALHDLEAQLAPEHLEGAADADSMARAEAAIETAMDASNFHISAPTNPQLERAILPAFALRA